MMKMMKNWQVDRQRVTKWSSELKLIVLFILRASWNFHLKRTYILCYHSLYFLTIIIHHYQDDHWAYLKILSHSHLSPNSNLISSSSSVSPNPSRFLIRSLTSSTALPPFGRPGCCPAVRPECPTTRVGPPETCSHDHACTRNPTDKCCFDRCLGRHVCKPAQPCYPF